MQVKLNKRGFTLIEVLVVMAISVILVGLILAPVVQSFRMTRQAQAMADAQDSSRRAMELISRDLGEAMFVFDNAVMPIAVFSDGTTPTYTYNSGEEGPLLLPVRQPNDTINWFTLPHGKLDFILPKMSMHCNNPDHPQGESRDYPRGNEAWPACPVCGSSEVDARPKMPLEQDVTVVRYFLGLRYNDPTYDPATFPVSDLPEGEGLFGWRSPYVGQTPVGTENQVVLYRVEFDPHDDLLFPSNMPIEQRLSDPIFFYRTATNSAGQPCCKAWMDRARVIGMGKYQDLLVGTFDPGSGNVTAVEPTVSFRFTAIDNDTFSATYSHDRNFDYPSIAPTVYRAAYGYWISPEGITLYRYRGNDTDAYTTEYNSAGHLMIVKRSSDDGWAPNDEFDITQYLDDLENANLTSIVRPGTTEPPDVAFYFDYTTFPDPANASRKVIAFTPSRGVVHFSLIPPKLRKGKLGPVMELDPVAINSAFHGVYSSNRGGAMRAATLSLPGGARVVPGSERIIGPNMTPGPYYGGAVLYERVPLQLGDPGLNQYKIDYDTGDVFFSSVFDQDLPELPDPSGGIMPLTADYKVQLNQKGDVVKGDYTTKAMVTVHLGMRMFDPDSAKAFPVDLTNSIKVRNALR